MEAEKMSTYMANADTVTRSWYILDAADKPLGKTAALAADIIRGKLKTTYTPHVDCGDFVIIINAEKAVLTGKKLEQKYYYTHSSYVGGLKATQYKRLMSDKPELAMELAVKGMLQKNKLASDQLTRLKVFRGAEHTHQAQKPEAWDR
jgi:large subunit ribosomal protein L13